MRVTKAILQKITAFFVNNFLWGNVIIFLATFLIFGYILSMRYKILEENEKKEMHTILNTIKHDIDATLRSSYSSCLTLALTIDNHGNANEFESVAKEIINTNDAIHSVQLVPNGIITYVYPVEGNESLLGYDILRNPLEKKIFIEAQKSINKKEIVFAGPFNLKQGGVGIVGRLPIFIDNTFWGFSAIVIKLDTFLNTIGILAENNDDYAFQFSKKIR